MYNSRFLISAKYPNLIYLYQKTTMILTGLFLTGGDEIIFAKIDWCFRNLRKWPRFQGNSVCLVFPKFHQDTIMSHAM